jgi:DNA-binding NarL/FixJ family response regulator
VLTLAEGKPDHEIAQQLFLSTWTVGHRGSSILAKVEVPSRTAAAAAATRMGIIERRDGAAPA